MRVPGFEPGISPPQGEVLTTILHAPGEAGYRSVYLSHAKRALYHLSYIPRHVTCDATTSNLRMSVLETTTAFEESWTTRGTVFYIIRSSN